MQFPYIREMILEICANSYESAVAAQKAGAHRIELCQELAVGGITPSHGLLKKVTQELEIPVYVLIRPRSGDFVYTESEFDVMLRNIAFAKAIGCKGIVSGVLNRDFTIDQKRTAQLLSASSELDFTFHRAFDWTPDAIEALQTIEHLGIKRVLTSGQAPSATEGFELLKELQDNIPTVSIMPGGGIRIENIGLFKEAGFKEIHASASSHRQGATGPVAMYSFNTLQMNRVSYSDEAKIQGILNALRE